MHYPNAPSRGFTLIELLVVIGMLAILSTIVLVAVNPLRQFAQARNTERENDVAAILNAVSERVADNGGMFATTTDPGQSNCAVSLASDTQIPIGNGTNDADIESCLVPDYLSALPKDPSTGVNNCPASGSCDGSRYELGYTIAQNSNTNRITVCAPGAAEAALPNSQSFCLSR